MRKEKVVDFQNQVQLARDELLGEWYNYETEDAPLTGRQIDHWLSRLEEPLRFPSPRSRV